MIPVAARLRKRYAELRMPLRLIAGAADRVAHVEPRSGRLHRELPASELFVLAGAGGTHDPLRCPARDSGAHHCPLAGAGNDRAAVGITS